MIKLSQKILPFSHKEGSKCIIPLSDYIVEAFPTLISLIGPRGERFDLNLNIVGRVDNFTLEQNLDKNFVNVFGRSKDGCFCFKIFHCNSEITIEYKKNNCITIPATRSIESKKSYEKLYLGVDKKLDWDLVIRRCNLAEIFQVLFLLGQKIPFATVDKCSSYENEDEFESLIRAGFSDILVPISNYKRNLGIVLDDIPNTVSPLVRLKSAYLSIRRLFIFEDDKIHILPNLFSQFHCGRLIDIELKNCCIDFMWSKKKIKKIVIYPIKDSTFSFVFPKEISSFRLRTNHIDRGKTIQCDDKIILYKSKRYYLDKFQK